MSWSGETADAGDLKSLGAIRTGSNPVFSMRGSSVAAGFFLCPEGMDASIPARLYEGDGLEHRPAVRRLAGRASRAANEHGCLTEKIDGWPEENWRCLGWIGLARCASIPREGNSGRITSPR